MALRGFAPNGAEPVRRDFVDHRNAPDAGEVTINAEGAEDAEIRREGFALFWAAGEGSLYVSLNFDTPFLRSRAKLLLCASLRTRRSLRRDCPTNLRKLDET